MATKTISITEKAYDILKNKKKSKESFSDVITRTFGKRSILEFAGILSKETGEELRKNIKKTREEMDKRMRHTAQRLQ
jgi:predicted CopG family antitoxin